MVDSFYGVFCLGYACEHDFVPLCESIGCGVALCVWVFFGFSFDYCCFLVVLLFFVFDLRFSCGWYSLFGASSIGL